MQPIISVAHIWYQVAEDAADLITLVGLTAPLVSVRRRLRDNDDIAHAGRLLRKLLSRSLVLTACRLHEPTGSGRTGETASIDSLLDLAELDIGERALRLKEKRAEIVRELESEGINFKHLRTFRTAEIAHSLHRHDNASDGTLTYQAISKFAERTYALVLEIERELAVSGLITVTDDLRLLPNAWHRRGTEFWSRVFW